MALTDKLSAIGDAIRAGTGKSGLLTLDEMPGEIRALSNEGVGPKEVNFYDYDGTILHAYTADEMMALTELPPLPSHSGLICQGWNWTLEGLQAAERPMNVGAMYITDDGKTRLYIRIPDTGRMDVPLYFYQSEANGVTIDWGDGNATETLTDTGYVNTVHTYAAAGDYTITLDPADGCELTLGNNSTSYCVMGDTSEGTYRAMLRKLEIGRNVTRMSQYAIGQCMALTTVTLPSGMTTFGAGVFRHCYALTCLVYPIGMSATGSDAVRECHALASVCLPESATTVGTTALYRCYALTSITLPDALTVVGGSLLSGCASISSIAFPAGVTTIRASAFNSCSGMAVYDFTRHTAVPTLDNTNAFIGIPSDCEIRVPAALVDEWKAATNWATYADYIVGV